jgi:hypothetical protein
MSVVSSCLYGNMKVKIYETTFLLVLYLGARHVCQIEERTPIGGVSERVVGKFERADEEITTGEHYIRRSFVIRTF